MPASPLSGGKAVDAAQDPRVHDHRNRYAVFDYLCCDIIHGVVCANRNDLKTIRMASYDGQSGSADGAGGPEDGDPGQSNGRIRRRRA